MTKAAASTLTLAGACAMFGIFFLLSGDSSVNHDRSLKAVSPKDITVKLDPNFEPHLGKKCHTFPTFPQRPALRPLLDVPLPNRGVFLSCADVDVDDADTAPSSVLLECYFRTAYSANTVSKVYLDGNFHIASNVVSEVMEGQDPRVFNWKGKVHVTDNRTFRNKIREMNDDGHQEASTWHFPEYIAPMKNVSPIPVSGKDIMFADFDNEKLFNCEASDAKPIDALKCDEEPLPNVEWHYEKIGGPKTTGWRYRGGSAGKKIADYSYVGFGHLTDPASAHHDIFAWKIVRKPDGSGIDVMMSYVNHGEQHDHGITDPTTLICMNDAWHVITAESDDYWSHDQGFVQRVYRVVEDDVANSSTHSHYNAVPLPKE